MVNREGRRSRESGGVVEVRVVQGQGQRGWIEESFAIMYEHNANVDGKELLLH